MTTLLPEPWGSFNEPAMPGIYDKDNGILKVLKDGRVDTLHELILATPTTGNVPNDTANYYVSLASQIVDAPDDDQAPSGGFTQRFACRATAGYDIDIFAAWDPSNAGSRQLELVNLTTGDIVPMGSDNMTATGVSLGIPTYQSLHLPARLTAGHEFGIRARQNSGGTLGLSVRLHWRQKPFTATA